MINYFPIFILTLMLSFNSFTGKASHVAGGSIEWTCVGQDSFLIKLTVYRDCNGIPMNTSANIPIRCASTGASITFVSIASPNPIDITPTCSNLCNRCGSSSCSFPYGFQKYVFQKLVVLSNAGSCCKVSMSYTNCCRNGSITTGAANKNFYIRALLDRCISLCDNSPVFTNDPISVVCIGQDVVFNHGVIDYDTNSYGDLIDSISYEWTSPLSGVSSAISYTGQYAYNRPIYFWGFPNKNLPFPRGFHLDAATGDISFRPMKIENTIMAIKIGEWRKINGVMTLIGQINRDYPIIVLSCPNNNAPIITSSLKYNACPGETINIHITTDDYDTNDSTFISWNNSILGANWSDSNHLLKHASANFSWIPDSNDLRSTPYTFNVTVKDDACPIYAYSTKKIEILVLHPVTGIPKITDLGCSNYAFDVDSLNKTGATFSWTDMNSNKLLHEGKSFNHSYYFPGIYPIRLNLESCGKEYYYDTIITTDSIIHAQLSSDTIACHGGIFPFSAQLINSSKLRKFWWSNGNDTSLSINQYVGSDSYVSFTVEDSNACKYVAYVKVSIDDIDVITYNSQYKCKGDATTIWAYTYPDEGNSYTVKWNLSPSPMIIDSIESISVITPGYYVVEMEDDLGCKDKDSILVVDHTFPSLDAGPDTEVCSDDTLFKLIGSPYSPLAEWSGDYVIKFNNNYWFDITQAYTNGSKHTMTYIYYNGNCKFTDTKMIQYFDKIEPDAGFDKNICINDNPVRLSGIPVGGSWSGLGIENSDYFNPAKAGVGIHKLVYTYSISTCIGFDTLKITVHDFDTNTLELKTEYNKLDFCHEYNQVKLIGNPSGGYWTGNIVNGNYFDASVLKGNQTFKYYYTDQHDCKFYKSITVNIRDAAVQINRNDTIVCKAEDLQINATYNLANGVKWMKSPSSDGFYIGSVYNTTAKYKMGALDINNEGFWIMIRTNDPICKDIWDSVFININVVEADFSADSSSGTKPFTVYFTDQTNSHTAAISSWLWIFEDNNTSTVQNPSHTYQDTGYFDVSLKVISIENCTDSISKKDFIHSMHNISIAELDESQIMVYPNPTDNEFIVKLVNKDDRLNQVSIICTDGRTVKQYENLNSSELLVQDLNLSSGIYFIKVNCLHGDTYYNKLLLK